MVQKNKNLILALFFIIISSLLISFTMIRSGLICDYGMGFWGPNAHDGIWHLSVINQFSYSFPPKNPVFSNLPLNNYHWGYDFFVFLLSSLTHINPINLYFQITPILFAFLLGILSYFLAKKIYDHTTALFFTFLIYFAGSLGWIYTAITSNQIAGESLFWSMQSASTLINPPYALSLIFILSGLLLYYQFFKSNKTHFAILIGFVFSLLTLIKIYAAIILDWVRKMKN